MYVSRAEEWDKKDECVWDQNVLNSMSLSVANGYVHGTKLRFKADNVRLGLRRAFWYCRLYSGWGVQTIVHGLFIVASPLFSYNDILFLFFFIIR